MIKRMTALCLSVLLSFMLCAAASGEETFSFANLEGRSFIFSSGAGAWFTELNISVDGSFTGSFHDSDMGDSAEEYPNGKVYYCDFHGILRFAERIDAHTLKLAIDMLEKDDPEAKEYVEDGILFLPEEPYGLSGTDHLLLYLPGAPMEELPEDFLFWLQACSAGELGDTLTVYGLYNEDALCGFISQPEPAE